MSTVHESIIVIGWRESDLGGDMESIKSHPDLEEWVIDEETVVGVEVKSSKSICEFDEDRVRLAKNFIFDLGLSEYKPKLFLLKHQY